MSSRHGNDSTTLPSSTVRKLNFEIERLRHGSSVRKIFSSQIITIESRTIDIALSHQTPNVKGVQTLSTPDLSMSLSDISDWEHTPLQAPPQGVVPNFINPENRAHKLHAAVAVCLPVILIFAAMRFYAKIFLLRSRTWDDYSYILSLSAGVTYIALLVSLSSQGVYGVHSWDIMVALLSVKLIRISLLVAVIYSPVVWLVKLSLFLLFLEIFRRLRWMRYCVYFGITLTGLFYLSVMTALAVLCGPREGQSQASYLSAMASPRCAHSKAVNLVGGIFNVVTDFYILILPLPAVWSLQLPTRKKIGVSAIFLTGLAACISSILGMVYRVPVSASNDNTWTVIPLWVVSTVEMSAGVIIPCMPMVAVIYRHIRSPVFLYLEKYKKKFDSLITIIGTAYKHRTSGSTEQLDSTYDDSSSETTPKSQNRIANEKIDPEAPLRELQPALATNHAQIYKTTKIEINGEPRDGKGVVRS